MTEAAPQPTRRERIFITAETQPKLPRHIKLRHDPGRGRWHVLAPERVFEPDPIAVEILKLCDGATNVQAIADKMAVEYNAPVDQITTDIIAMLQELADKGVVEA